LSQINLKKKINSLFRSLNIKKGDKLIIHTNIAGLFQFSNNSKSMSLFLNLILKKIGPTGTLVIPTYNYDFTKGKPYIKNKSPSHVGMFTNYLLKKYSKKRTNNPIFSHLIFGKLSKALHLSDNFEMFGERSIFANLLRFDFKIICFCCSPAFITLIHYFEKILDVDYRFDKFFKGKIKIHNKLITKVIKYRVGKKKINYKIKEKNLLELFKKNNFLEKPFGRFLCYSVKASYFYSSIKKKIQKNSKFLIKNENH
jgi:aminoglycoside 3-N-acetyltransferase